MSEQILRTNGRDGDEVRSSQTMDSTFTKVSAPWIQQCMTYERGKEVLAQQQSHIEDIYSPLEEWEVKEHEGSVAFIHGDTPYKLAPQAVVNACAIGRVMSAWAIQSLMEPIGHPTKRDADDNPVTIPGGERTPEDARVLADYIRIHLFNPKRTDTEKMRLFRTWRNVNGENTIRAILGADYSIVDNRWVLEQFERLIPGGLLSHWKGDADTIYGNILIPDTIRQEADSDFGGMVSIGNSEVGLRRISSTPSVFRAICMNGCIYGGVVGDKVSRVHRGITLEEISNMLRDNLQKQIPLIPMFMDAVLNTRTYGMGDTLVTNLVAQVSVDNSLSKKQTHAIMREFTTEYKLLGNEARSAYGLLNAITRAGQKFDAPTWLKFDAIAGGLADSRDSWDKLRNRADNLTEKQVIKRFGEAVAA